MSKQNVAIIIAVSDYSAVNPLPGCENDKALIQQIIEKTGRFAPDNILHFDADTTSGTVKTALSRFIAARAGRQVGDVFFYYSGHGLFDGSTFYYLFSDYAQARLQGTALTNTELDEMLRSLNADLTVKVIDACFSAQQYVKSSEDLEKALKAPDGTFKHCYFMFSSEQTQPSWQDGNLSYFTMEFARAIHQHSSLTIRYKDIIDFVSDSFDTDDRQTPIFVTQASFTEEFCEVNDDLRKAISAFMPIIPPSITISSAPPPKQTMFDELKHRVQKESSRYCTEEEAVNAFAIIKSVIEAYRLPDPLFDLYTLSRTFMQDSFEVPNPKAIGEWLQKNLGDFFAKLEYTKEDYETEEPYYRRNAFLAITVPLIPEYRTVIKQRDVVSGFDSTAPTPFKSVHLVAQPKLQNVPWWKWYAAFICSKTEIRCFSTAVRLKDLNWAQQRQQGKIEWRIKDFSMKEAEVVKETVHGQLSQFADTMTRYLMDRYGLGDAGSAASPPQKS